MFVNFSKIRLLLEKKGLNQQDLAIASGLSHSNISRYLSGKQKPGIDALSKIAHALDVKITDLVDEKAPLDPQYEQKVFRRDEFEIVKYWNALSPEQKTLTKRLIEQMINSSQGENAVKKKRIA